MATPPRTLPAGEYWFEDLQEGDRYETGGIVVTESHIVSYAGLSGDLFDVHMDDDFARAGISRPDRPWPARAGIDRRIKEPVRGPDPGDRLAGLELEIPGPDPRWRPHRRHGHGRGHPPVEQGPGDCHPRDFRVQAGWLGCAGWGDDAFDPAPAGRRLILGLIFGRGLGLLSLTPCPTPTPGS